MSNVSVLKNLPNDEVFICQNDYVMARSGVRRANKQAIVHNWMRAHERMLRFRREHEKERVKEAGTADHFWYSSPNRIVIALAVVSQHIEGIKTTISGLAGSTALTRQTVSTIVRDAQDAGFVNEELVPDRETQQLVYDRVYDIITTPEFTTFAESLTMHEMLARQPINPYEG